MPVPSIRIRPLLDADVDADGDFVLYWMVAHRRPTYNFALQRACETAAELDRPLVILEALRHGYRWACDRFHNFVIDGMAHNRRTFDERPVRYYPFVETSDDSGSGLLNALADDACAVVTDDFPCFFLPRMLDAAADVVDVRMEAVDSNGLVPMRAPDKLFKRAWDFRRYLHHRIADDDLQWPARDPIDDAELPSPIDIPDHIAQRWPEAGDDWLDTDGRDLQSLPIDHGIEANPEFPGGLAAARSRLQQFFDNGLDDYHERRNELTEQTSSNLSPYFHFGHISSHRVFDELREREDWIPGDVDDDRIGKSEGFWSMSDGAESFADEFISWREVGFNRCALDPDGYDDYDTLPEWARETLGEHADDPRPHVYSLREFEAATTHDELWNAAQMQLVETGTMHNYIRMLWGKKILHWSPSPRAALDIMIELNNKYALDGRDPNSYNGIFWVLGRFDRAWGPEREVFGKIRYMTIDSTHRKFSTDAYIERFAPDHAN